MNQKLIVIPIIILSIIIGVYLTNTSTENLEVSKKFDDSFSTESEPLIIQTHVNSIFKVLAYEDDFEMIDGKKIWRNVVYELDESKSEIYSAPLRKVF